MTILVRPEVAGKEDPGWVVLHASNTPTASTASASLVTLRTVTIPGGLMGANDTLLFQFGAQKTNTNDTWAISIYFGNQLVINESTIIATSDNWTTENYMQNANSTGDQILRHPTQADLAPAPTTLEFYTFSVDTTADVDVEFKSSVVNASDSSRYLWTRIVLIKGTV